jgi:pantothenate kinase type III
MKNFDENQAMAMVLTDSLAIAQQPNINRYLRQSLDHIFQNNKKWVSSKKQTDASFFGTRLSLQPMYLICR